jgi:hypothetical protein
MRNGAVHLLEKLEKNAGLGRLKMKNLRSLMEIQINALKIDID